MKLAHGGSGRRRASFFIGCALQEAPPLSDSPSRDRRMWPPRPRQRSRFCRNKTRDGSDFIVKFEFAPDTMKNKDILFFLWEKIIKLIPFTQRA